MKKAISMVVALCLMLSVAIPLSFGATGKTVEMTEEFLASTDNSSWYGNDSSKPNYFNNYVQADMSSYHELFWMLKLNIERDHVVDTIPAIGTQVEKNEKVIIQISKGSWRAESALSTITWWNISGNADTWEFVKPYIQENVLYIECKPTFGTAGKWVDDNDTGKIIGNVTINDKYTCTVTAAYSQKEWNAKDTQSFTLKIPLEEFTEERPIHLDISLFANVNKKFKEVNVEFNIAW